MPCFTTQDTAIVVISLREMVPGNNENENNENKDTDFLEAVCITSEDWGSWDRRRW